MWISFCFGWIREPFPSKELNMCFIKMLSLFYYMAYPWFRGYRGNYDFYQHFTFNVENERWLHRWTDICNYFPYWNTLNWQSFCFHSEGHTFLNLLHMRIFDWCHMFSWQFFYTVNCLRDKKKIIYHSPFTDHIDKN